MANSFGTDILMQAEDIGPCLFAEIRCFPGLWLKADPSLRSE